MANENASEAAQRGTRKTLVIVLESVLRLTHPIMPFITEEIWQTLAPLAGKSADGSIMSQPYPLVDNEQLDVIAVADMEWLMEFITGVRSIRSQMNIPPKKKLDVQLKDSTKYDQKRLSANHEFLSRLGNLESITLLKGDAPAAATALVGKMEILIPLDGLIDKNAEIQRLDKEITKFEKIIKQSTDKLNNDNYVARAPADVVQKERDKLGDIEQALSQLQQQRQSLT